MGLTRPATCSTLVRGRSAVGLPTLWTHGHVAGARWRGSSRHRRPCGCSFWTGGSVVARDTRTLPTKHPPRCHRWPC